MNHEPSTSPPQHPSATQTTRNGESAQRSKQVGDPYKVPFLDHLIRHFDIAIYTQLSVLYYMDCSMFLFFGRATNHWFYFTPKPALMNPIVSSNRPNIVAIILLNVVSVFVHYINLPPTAGEATRGYLHGGLLIDFVGQQSPVSRFRLIAYDALILGLQLVMLAVTDEKRRLLQPSSPLSDGATNGEDAAQDHDSEERGIRRSEVGTEAVEMRSLPPVSEGQAVQEEGPEGEESSGNHHRTTREHPGDAFYSGQYVIADVRILSTIQHHWTKVYTGPNGTSSHNSMGAAAELARRRLGLRARIIERGYR